MRLINNLLVMVWLGLSYPAVAEPDNNWQRVYQEDGVQVYLGEQPGSPYKIYKGITTVDADIKQILALFHDNKSYPKWLKGTVSSTATVVGGSRRIVHNKSTFPWPMNPRDVVFESRAQVESATGTLTINFFPPGDLLPPEEGYIRIEKGSGFWRLRPLSPTRTEVTYQVHIEPGGWVPGWVYNRVIADVPKQTLKNMARLLATEKSIAVSQ